MTADELDELYRVKPEDFTAVRSRLVAAAKDRGDAAAAKQIASSRKPTTAAWAVNRLALSRSNAKQRLTELGERLRAAHAATDGGQIRELSAEQRRLIDELSRAAFEAAEVADPSAALREDVTGTLQAAIADPDLAARLGRLAKAERWSGFGDFGVTATVSSAAHGANRKADRDTPDKRGDREPAREQLDRARETLAAAERARSEADAALSERYTELTSARWRHQEARKGLDKARKGLDKAQRELDAAEDAHDKARQASRDAAELVTAAKAQLKQTL
jgi:hypothetical protein